MTTMAGWQEVEVCGKTVDLFVPEGELAGAVLFLSLYDGASIVNNATYTTLLQRHRLAAVSPRGPQCWWCDVIYPPYDPERPPINVLHEDVTPWMQERFGLKSSLIAVAGIEMGGQGALQFGYRYGLEHPIVVAISPKVDFETWYGHGLSLDDLFPTREHARQATAVLQMHPLNWPRHQLLVCDPADVFCFEGTQVLSTKLSSSGTIFEEDLKTTCGGYGWEYWNRMADPVLSFIAARLEQEQRRLPIVAPPAG